MTQNQEKKKYDKKSKKNQDPLLKTRTCTKKKEIDDLSWCTVISIQA